MEEDLGDLERLFRIGGEFINKDIVVEIDSEGEEVGLEDDDRKRRREKKERK